MNELNDNPSRKPNLKKWICPLDGVPVNTRGAPSYLRNKYHLPWNEEYLTNPDLLCKESESQNHSRLFIEIKGLFSEHRIRDEELVNCISKYISSLVGRTRFALLKKDISRLKEINERLRIASEYPFERTDK